MLGFLRNTHNCENKYKNMKIKNVIYFNIKNKYVEE